MNRRKVLFVTGAVTPLQSTNANIIRMLIDAILPEADCWLLSIAPYTDQQLLAGDYPFYCIKLSSDTGKLHSVNLPKNRKPICIRKHSVRIARLLDRFLDRSGVHDLMPARLGRMLINQLMRREHFDAVIASIEPYYAAYAMAKSRNSAKKILYMIDPFVELVPILCDHNSAFRENTHRSILNRTDLILTTDRVAVSMKNSAYQKYLDKVFACEFPLLAKLKRQVVSDRIEFDQDKINLLYCGWLRGEQQLCRVIERLDDRFCVTFLGNDNARMQKLVTAAEIRTIPAVPRQVAVNAILDADVLLSTGNDYPIHIPSKTFDYLSSGKPIIHFYSIPNCPALDYYHKYPLSLCLSGDGDADELAARVRSFCLRTQDKRLSWDEVCGIYPDLRADFILEKLKQAILNEEN